MAPSSVHAIGSQELRGLLLPALACLPTAFLSPKPPPALLPLLSPILRQRVYIQPASSDPNPHHASGDGWLHLLTWSRERATQLAEVVSTLQLEPHPVSGELELFGDTNDRDIEKVWYRSLDDETVQARYNVQGHNLAFTWVWCPNDTGEVGIGNLMNLDDSTNQQGTDGWRIAEVTALEGDENMQLDGWQDDIKAIGPHLADGRSTIVNGNATAVGDGVNGTDQYGSGEDDDYWASYDKTPGQGSAAPTPGRDGRRSIHGESDRDYFERYATEVQPALDAHDPGEQAPEHQLDHGRQDDTTFTSADSMHTGEGLRHLRNNHTRGRSGTIVGRPTALSTSTGAVMNQESSAAEATVKHHISGEIKHLFKLSRGVGMEREEFESLVRRELEVLSLLE